MMLMKLHNGSLRVVPVDQTLGHTRYALSLEFSLASKKHRGAAEEARTTKSPISLRAAGFGDKSAVEIDGSGHGSGHGNPLKNTRIFGFKSPGTYQTGHTTGPPFNSFRRVKECATTSPVPSPKRANRYHPSTIAVSDGTPCPNPEERTDTVSPRAPTLEGLGDATTPSDSDLADRSPAGLRVLVVDDVPMNRRMLSRVLQGPGRSCVEAVDGLDALSKWQEAETAGQPVHVILMDYQMPNMDGPSATRELRQLGYTGLVIGVTGNALPQDKKYFLECGADRVLIKPVDRNCLESAISGIFEYMISNYLLKCRSQLMVLFLFRSFTAEQKLK